MQQTYLQSLTVRLEEMRIKRRDSEQWMHHRALPEDLKERVRRYDQYKWLETRGVDEENLVQSLPKDLRRDIKRHLCLNLVRRVRIIKSTFFLVLLQPTCSVSLGPAYKSPSNLRVILVYVSCITYCQKSCFAY